MIFDRIRSWIDGVVGPWLKSQNVETIPAYTLEDPPAGIDADVACNLAMVLAKSLRKNPRALAQELQTLLQGQAGPFASITIAGAGFLNFRLALGEYLQELRAIRREPDRYGRLPSPPADRVLIEFVSANPTGPLHVGHGRGAALGDSLAHILAHMGYDVTREYYINDAGNQVQMLGESVVARVRELKGQALALPEQGYHGDYIKDVAAALVKESPADAENSEAATQFALKRMQAAIESDLADFGVRFDSWFSEAALVRQGRVEQAVETLRSRGFLEEADGALWFIAPGEKTDDGEQAAARDKNRVIRRKDGRWTYFASDIAYHADKFARGFTRLIDVWGADHHGYVPRVKGSIQALGYEPGRLHVVLNQMVSLTRNGVPVSMSKRSGEFITLKELVAEVGRDACRFFFAMRGPNTAFDFDLELAKKHSNDNPVYYVQYAHARICSIFRNAGESGQGIGDTEPPLELLTQPEERDLLRRLSLFPETLAICAQEDSPHPLTSYLMLVCRQFHHFYDHHRVLDQAGGLTQARLALLDGVRQVLRVGLKLLGVGAPEEM